MFNTTDLLDGQKFKIQFVAEPKDAYVLTIIRLLGQRANGPVTAMFFAAGSMTKTGATAIHDTVCVQINDNLWGGLWPHEDGTDYYMVSKH